MDALQLAKDAAYAAVGRNLLLVQQIEHLLKLILCNSRRSGPVSEFPKIIQEDFVRVAKLPMGSVIKELAETLFGPIVEEVESKEIKEVHYRFEVKFESESFRRERIAALKELLDERNLFVHHLASTIQLDMAESWNRLTESQMSFQSRLIREVEYYQGLVRSLRESHQEHVRDLQSDEARRDFELQFLLQSPLVLSLASIWYERKRADGWCLLSSAGSLLAVQMPDEYRSLLSKYGCKSLSDLISASKVFELSSEVDSFGGARSIFRLRPEVFREVSEFN